MFSRGGTFTVNVIGSLLLASSPEPSPPPRRSSWRGGTGFCGCADHVLHVARMRLRLLEDDARFFAAANVRGHYRRRTVRGLPR